MGFTNPVLGGLGVLVRSFIRSANYVAGVSGWTVNKDGTAEFQNATIRGTVSASTVIGALIESAASGRRTTVDANGDIKVYNASGAVLFWFNNADNAQFYYADTGTAAQGALAESIAAVAGTDPFGNTYQAGMTTYAGSTGTFINLNGGALKAVSSAPGGSIDAPVAGQLEVIAVNTLILGASSATGYIAINSPLSAPIVISKPGALGTAETWNPMTLLNGWTSGARVAPQYRLVASPPKTVEVIGSLTAPAGIVAGQVIWNVPTGYTVTNPQSIVARNQSTNAAVMLSITLGSPQTLQYQAGAVAGNVIDFHAFISQDA